LFPSFTIRPVTSITSRYPYFLCFGIANISERLSRVLATRRPGRPYRANVSQVGKRVRRSISKPDTAGCVSGMTNTKPSVDDGGSECMVMSPSIFNSVDVSISSLACG